MQYSTIVILLILYKFIVIENVNAAWGDAYGMLNKIQTECENLALRLGTRLADSFNAYDEETEWDQRVHHDFISTYLGFAGWMVGGTWGSGGMTADKSDAKALYKKGGWIEAPSLNESSVWAFENQWIYYMGDSTSRQVWATFVSSFQGNNFERNAKEWTRENCLKQYPHRKQHPAGGYFHDEGWGGKCGNNEVTCHLSGYGPEGKLTFDWKHFPFEDYDEWLFSPDGLWKNEPTERRPDVLAIQVGLHTCFHAVTTADNVNKTMLQQHEAGLKVLMDNIQIAIDRPNLSGHKTLVIFITSGRTGILDYRADQCIWRFNRVLAREAHRHKFTVLEREEIERRFLFKAEHFAETRWTKFSMHLDTPGPQIVGTSLLALVACLRRNGTAPQINEYF